MLRLSSLALLAAPALLLAVACGSDSSTGTASPVTSTATASASTSPVVSSPTGTGTPCEQFTLQPTKGVTPIVVVSELVPGPNRFAFALQSDQGPLVEGPPVHVKFFPPCNLDQPAFEADATWRGLSTTNPQESSGAAPKGIYVVDANFSQPGQWVAEYVVSGPQAYDVKSLFSVRETATTPAIGAPAPASKTAVFTSGGNIKQIDSSDPPHPEFLQLSIADAVAQHKPAVVIFATPAFCQSRICGPVFEEAASLYPAYKDRVAFIHVEPYELQADGQPVTQADGSFKIVPAIQEWGFQSEPWVVVIDAQGRVAAKFEGLTNADEIRAAVDKMLAPAG